jgi:hypothetical protein
MYLTGIFKNKAARKGALIATNQRIIFYAKGITGYELDSTTYGEINNLEIQRTVGTWQLRYTTARTTYHLRYAKGEVEQFAHLVRSRIGQGAMAQVAPIQQSGSVADELGKLGELLRQSLINQQEFEQQKDRLLQRGT